MNFIVSICWIGVLHKYHNNYCKGLPSFKELTLEGAMYHCIYAEATNFIVHPFVCPPASNVIAHFLNVVWEFHFIGLQCSSINTGLGEEGFVSTWNAIYFSFQGIEFYEFSFFIKPSSIWDWCYVYLFICEKNKENLNYGVL